ncbi:MAG: hypothetical protein HY002_17450 [Candidatus Rokubacteria bacterium]|nr:hypothetical protein [Candidatus Rokubacteria bacterium]
MPLDDIRGEPAQPTPRKGKGNLVAAHFLDGAMIKGVCFDFPTEVTLDRSPAKAMCQIETAEGMVVVWLGDLKALFFVRDLEGDPAYRERKELDPADLRRVGARPLEVRFRDGETLVGLATGYSIRRNFFFMVPADPRSNNIRILVNREGAESVTLLPMSFGP